MTLFGTDGIRDVFGQSPITEIDFFHLGKSFAIWIKKQSKHYPVTIARDSRSSGIQLSKALIYGIKSESIDTHFLDIAPTGACALFASSQQNFSAVITASHNPSDYNGLKFFNENGLKLSRNQEEEIDEIFSKLKSRPADFNLKNSNEISIKKNSSEKISNYYKNLIEKYPLSKKFLRNNQLCFDGANGSVSDFIPLIIGISSSHSFATGIAPDGDNINKDCGATNTGIIKKLIQNFNLNAGISFDGDGDRIIIIDELGRELSGEHLLFLLILDAINNKRKVNSVVGSIMTNKSFENKLNEIQINLIRTDVGDRNIAYEMLNYDAEFGGEPSGHIINKNIGFTGDGLSNFIVFAHIFEKLNLTPKNLFDSLTLFPQIQINVNISRKLPVENIPLIDNAIKYVEKELGNNGRCIVRFSGTEPVIRIMVEACSEKLALEYANFIKEKILKSELV